MTSPITRHYLTIGKRRVHYRKCGSGPTLLMVHQSPRSGAEYERLMSEWGEHFTCIAPDSPGYGNSDPLEIADPKLADFSQGLADFMDALGVKQSLVYGFHSGGAIAMNLMVREKQRFTAFFCGGYPIWNKAEQESFAAGYLPRFIPTAYGEHITWLWARIMEQSWFFPWYDVRNETRLTLAGADPIRINAMVHEVLDAGDNYRFGYNAVLQAGSDIPAAGTEINPAKIATYQGDPLALHMDRYSEFPSTWSYEVLPDMASYERTVFEFLKSHDGPTHNHFAEDKNAGFVSVKTPAFDGLIHWRGNLQGKTLSLHAPGQSMELLPDAELAFDLPGHGLSSPISNSAKAVDFAEVIVQAIQNLGLSLNEIFGEEISAILAGHVAQRLAVKAIGLNAVVPADAKSWIESLPDFTPDKYGNYLSRAWRIIRMGTFFWPWFDVKYANSIPFEESDHDPKLIALKHRALLRASAYQQLTQVLLSDERPTADTYSSWQVPDWTHDRALWRP